MRVVSSDRCFSANFLISSMLKLKWDLIYNFARSHLFGVSLFVVFKENTIITEG